MTRALKRKHSSIFAVIASCLLILFLLASIAGPSERLALFAAEGGFVHPVMSPRVSSDFGERNHPIFRVKRHHDGIDLAAPEGTPIRAISNGVVVFADPYRGYGNLVVIRHRNNMTSHYGHCKSIKVSPGQHVRAGQIIATVGQTGNVTGPHLHLEVRLDGVPQDPEEFIPGLRASPRG